jgi:hypothetical protein
LKTIGHAPTGEAVAEGEDPPLSLFGHVLVFEMTAFAAVKVIAHEGC